MRYKKTKPKYVCIICQAYIKKLEDGFFTCPVCGNTTKANEIIEEEFSNRPSIWDKIIRIFKW